MDIVRKYATPRDDVVTSMCAGVQNIIYDLMSKNQRMPYIIAVQADASDAEITFLLELLRKRLNNVVDVTHGEFTCNKTYIAPPKYGMHGFMPAIIGLHINFEINVSDARIAELSGKLDAAIEAAKAESAQKPVESAKSVDNIKVEPAPKSIMKRLSTKK